jgi:hypothetical protein
MEAWKRIIEKWFTNHKETFCHVELFVSKSQKQGDVIEAWEESDRDDAAELVCNFLDDYRATQERTVSYTLRTRRNDLDAVKRIVVSVPQPAKPALAEATVGSALADTLKALQHAFSTIAAQTQTMHSAYAQVISTQNVVINEQSQTINRLKSDVDGALSTAREAIEALESQNAIDATEGRRDRRMGELFKLFIGDKKDNKQLEDTTKAIETVAGIVKEAVNSSEKPV